MNYKITVAFCPAAAFLAVAISTHAAPETSAGTVIASLGELSVTSDDLEAEVLRLPPEQRAEFRSNPARVAKITESLIVTKFLAAGARKRGLDRQALVLSEIKLSEERVLARWEQERLEAAILVPDLSKRAEELYKSDPRKYSIQPTYRTQHILIDVKCRTNEAALERANQVRREILAGLDFNEAVSRYSDDPSAVKNAGDIWFVAAGAVQSEYSEAMQKLQRGEISQPVRTIFGWHLIKLTDTTAAKQYAFEEVRDSILKELRQDYIRRNTEEIGARIRSDPNIKVDAQALDAFTKQAGIPPQPASAR